MDLGFSIPTTADSTPVPAFDLMRVLADCGGLQADAAATAGKFIRPVEGEWLAPAGGSFSAAMAARLVEWRQP